MEHVKDHDADVVFLSETWMQSNNDDITAMIKPYGYKLLHNRRRNRDKAKGGGVGVMLKVSLSSKHLTSKPFSSFEHTTIKVQLKDKTNLTLITIYRLQFVATSIFLEEFTELLEMLSASGEIFILSGDINIHLDTDELDAARLKEIFLMFNLKQYADFPTHRLGHTLDLVLTRFDHPLIIDLQPNDMKLSDHFLLKFTVGVSATKTEYRTVTYRDTKSLKNEQFSKDIKEEYENIPICDMKEKVTSCHASMTKVVDSHAPLKTKQIKVVPNAPWFDFEYKALRRLRRKAEKRYRKTGLEVHKNDFVNLRKQTTTLAFEKKKTYYAKKIDQCNGNSKSLFACVNRLLDIKQNAVLPSHNSTEELANRFQTYFREKILNIRKIFPTIVNPETVVFPDSNLVLDAFEPATEDEIISIIAEYGMNCSPEDPIPISLLKNNIDIFIPIWLDIVNLSLSRGNMDCLKNAILTPLIKELDELIDVDVLKNYRPVSNLIFLSKLIERIVAIRIEGHMIKHGLHSNKQFGYKKNHSTEMLLVKIVNDLLIACDRKIPTVLMLLDLSAAFDTVDQIKLLKILHDEIGIQGMALDWFKSYLLNRTQKVKVGDAYSREEQLDYGVAQGSVLGPILFNIYTRSFPNKVESIGFEVEGFADDHQLWKQFSPIFQVKALGDNLDKCFKAISSWMNEFFLRLNSSKTKILVVAPPSVKHDIHINGTFIDGKCIRFVDSAKNLGIVLDTELSFNIQISKLVSSCFHTIRNISRIKKFLDEGQLKTLVSTLIFSKLDYCNALYYGLNTQLIDKMQVVQNSALRLVYNMHRYDRISTSPLFKKLHWLKVRERIVFKLLLIVHKCIRGTAPQDIKSMLHLSKSDRTKKLEITRSISKYGDRAFSVSAPKLWNALPRLIREELTTTVFKKSLKSFLLLHSESYFQVVKMK